MAVFATKDEIDQVFKAWLSEYISHHNLTQLQAAQIMNTTPATIHNILTGKKNASSSMMKKMAAGAGTTIQDVLNKSGNSLSSVPVSNDRNLAAIGNRPALKVIDTQAANDIQELSPKAQKMLADAPPITYLDGALLVDVVMALEEFLIERKKVLHPRLKAEIIGQMYQMVKEEEAKGSEARAGLRIIAPLLSKALDSATDEPHKKAI
ncbi:hypothetical protein C4J81_17205 [Deltaproteobacteria bacterium Smac51]|nr:hypothetical protein C4J81_17205 [Deltaproteobacteria bacterium Smac51]